jgi:hypothetical protein
VNTFNKEGRHESDPSALAMLVLSLTLFGATTAVAAAAPSTPSAVEDQNDRLLRGIEAAAAARTQAALRAGAVDGAQPHPGRR